MENELRGGLLFGYVKQNSMILGRNRRVNVVLGCFIALGVALKVKGAIWV